ncbi:putative potassium transport flavoprotein [Salinisphaera shabanensis T35B1]|uniref:Dimethylaniline monooxygenase N-oxide forming protein n=1 Tax=Salinisphaera shabanensis E1L3A TaxID=1033802 RepID=U2EJG0_9GAMM|nr:NAD(P)/FAD-dependent oxidoreductase [Salinisphaera shabanensis]ERJ18145.1 dimethylaniline monooxygenase N-oxide forming protein [Salinisphaera shabanensis E1L3A]
MLDTTVAVQANNVLNRLDEALTQNDIEAALGLFAAECYWRDMLAFTWNIKTAEGKHGIRDMLSHCLEYTQPHSWALDERESVTETGGVIEAWIVFETAVARGTGFVRIKDGLIWTLLTTMGELKGYEEPMGVTRPLGAKHGDDQGKPTWKEEREQELASLGVDTQPYVLIIGGGQGGIALGARLRQLGVPALIIEKNDRPGDSWRKRYKSLCLHDPVWYDHLPYIKFPRNWPVFAPKDKIGDWLEMYARVMELNYWGATEARRASYDEATQTWTVVVDRDGEQITLRPRQLVLATGMSAKPNVPSIEGQDIFGGIQQHSSEHPGPDGMAGKKVAVIGSNNSAHDICAALAENGVDVTMIQRSSTHISRSESLMKYALGPLYSEEALANGITTEKADMLFASIPYALLADFQKPIFDEIRKVDADFYDQLEKAGFMLDFGPDDSGLFMKYLRRASGYYIDVGASQMIIDGRIKLESGSEVARLTKNSVQLEDGREIPADVVIYATGYGSMNGWAADLISQDVADKVGKVWGLGSDTPKDPGPWEGEQRNMWKPTHQESLWFHGGNLAQSRFYSHFLALQLKARMEGIDTPVYGQQPVHHTS